MPSRNAADMANLAKANPYLQRLAADPRVRDNVLRAYGSGRSAYERLVGEDSARSVLENKKLQNDLGQALQALRDTALLMSEPPKRRRGLKFGGVLILALVGTGAALAASESLRTKLLDLLFGKEEEFEYTPPPPPPSSTPPASPVSAA